MYLRGYRLGYGAAFVTDWAPEAIDAKLETDEVGEIVLEAMDASDSPAMEEGCYDGLLDGLRAARSIRQFVREARVGLSYL